MKKLLSVRLSLLLIFSVFSIQAMALQNGQGQCTLYDGKNQSGASKTIKTKAGTPGQSSSYSFKGRSLNNKASSYKIRVNGWDRDGSTVYLKLYNNANWSGYLGQYRHFEDWQGESERKGNLSSAHNNKVGRMQCKTSTGGY